MKFKKGEKVKVSMLSVSCGKDPNLEKGRRFLKFFGKQPDKDPTKQEKLRARPGVGTLKNPLLILHGEFDNNK